MFRCRTKNFWRTETGSEYYFLAFRRSRISVRRTSSLDGAGAGAAAFDIIDLNSLVKQIINETEQEVAAKDMTICDQLPQQLILGDRKSVV